MMGRTIRRASAAAAISAIAACGGSTTTDSSGAGGAGGAAGAGGAQGGGTAGSGPFVDGGIDGSTPARIVVPAKLGKVSKIDLLFMIDNSSSMADKQFILAQAVPDLVNRLVDPVCVNPATGLEVGLRRPDGSCATREPDFDPVKDIHIGIITSSLGGHGTTGICDDPDPQKTLPHNNDKAHLIARDVDNNDAPVPTFMNEGFLSWNRNADPTQTPASII